MQVNHRQAEHVGMPADADRSQASSPATRRGSLGRRLLLVVVSLAVATGLVAGGWWAGRTALEPPRDPLVAERPVTVPVREGTVGRSLSLTAVARWQAVTEVRSIGGGVVTSIDVEGGTIGEGERLLSLDLRPVVLLEGSVPTFHDLGPNTEGPDVQQLQAYLERADFLTVDVDDVYGPATSRAVREWQRSLRVPVTGSVAAGSVVFTPQLPARVRLTVAVGDVISPGETLAEILGAEPQFEVALTDEQTALVPPGAQVWIRGDGGQWLATAGQLDRTENGGQRLRLAGPDGGSICGDQCDQVALDGSSSWSASIVLVPEVSGAVVPVSAVRTAADGRRFVVTDDGAEMVVDVVASADGFAVVEGVDVGTLVTIPEPPP